MKLRLDEAFLGEHFCDRARLKWLLSRLDVRRRGNSR